jgi:hypothetical protein
MQHARVNVLENLIKFAFGLIYEYKVISVISISQPLYLGSFPITFLRKISWQRS